MSSDDLCRYNIQLNRYKVKSGMQHDAYATFQYFITDYTQLNGLGDE